MSSGRICRTRTSPQHPKCRVLPLHHILYIGTLCYGSGPICLDIVIPAIDLTGYLYSLTRGVSTAAPFHGCASTVAHLSRPIGVFVTFATATLFTIILLLVRPTPQLIPGSRTPQPPFSPLGKKSFCAIYFNQADSCHPRTPTSQGLDYALIAAFFCGLFQTG